MAIELKVNGRTTSVDVDPGRSLLSVLRDELGLTGTKGGCGEGECGACTVLLDDRPEHACVTAVGAVGERAITTIEALAERAEGRALERAFVEVGALQCAFCTPGMVVAATGLLARDPRPDEVGIRAAMEGNICRCGTYPRIVRAVQRAADLLVAGDDGVRGDDAGPGEAAREDPTALAPADFILHSVTLRGPEGDQDETLRLPVGGLVAVRVHADGFMAGPGGPEAVSAWVHVAGDGRVTGYTGKVEVGQGNRTSLSQMIAAELRVPLDRVRLVMGDTERTPWDMGTFGSLSTPQAGARLREAAAAARELRDAGGTGVHLVRGEVALTPPTDWHVAGSPEPRVGGAALVAGRHRYPSDMRLPDMLVGRVLRPPRMGARLVAADVEAARAAPGVVVVQEGDFVGVAAPSVAQAQSALGAVKAQWTGGSEISAGQLFEHLRRTAEPRGRAGQAGWGAPLHLVDGDPAVALRAAEHVLERSYTVAYIAHVPLEPRAALARWDDGHLTVWTGTQRPYGVREELAETFDLPEERVRVLVPDTGSGYGGKHTGECAVEAARLARAAGRPVRVVWRREEEFRWAYFRPAGIIDVKTGARPDGTIDAFELENINSGAAGIRPVYAFPNQRLVYRPADSPLRQGSYRALAATANHFARELHLDELAARLGLDPVELRQRNLKDPRARAVLEAAAERFGWAGAGRGAAVAGAGDPPGAATAGSTAGCGIALGFEKGSYVATAVEVELPAAWDGGTAAPGRPGLRVTRIVTAFDCGAVVNPDNLRNQIEGALIMGLGGALFEAIDFENGVVSNARLSQYRVPRMSDVPPIEVIVLDRKDQRSAGAGETPIVALAPAIGAAMAAAGAPRPTGMPMARGVVVR